MDPTMLKQFICDSVNEYLEGQITGVQLLTYLSSQVMLMEEERNGIAEVPSGKL